MLMGVRFTIQLICSMFCKATWHDDLDLSQPDTENSLLLLEPGKARDCQTVGQRVSITKHNTVYFNPTAKIFESQCTVGWVG